MVTCSGKTEKDGVLLVKTKFCMHFDRLSTSAAAWWLKDIIKFGCLQIKTQAYQTVFVRSQHTPYKYSNFLANRYRKYLSFLKSAFTAVYLQQNELETFLQCLSLFLRSFFDDLKRARAVL